MAASLWQLLHDDDKIDDSSVAIFDVFSWLASLQIRSRLVPSTSHILSRLVPGLFDAESQRHFLLGSFSMDESGVVGVRARRCPRGEPNGEPLTGTSIPFTGTSSELSSCVSHLCIMHSFADIRELKNIQRSINFIHQEKIRITVFIISIIMEEIESPGKHPIKLERERQSEQASEFSLKFH